MIRASGKVKIPENNKDAAILTDFAVTTRYLETGNQLLWQNIKEQWLSSRIFFNGHRYLSRVQWSD